jgi:hypothetical protein
MKNNKGQFTNDSRPESKTGKMIACKHCGKECYVIKSRWQTFKYCSNACSNHKGYQKNTGRTHLKKAKVTFIGTLKQYKALHWWIGLQKGKASNFHCKFCLKQAQEWANISQEYNSDVNDYMPLCSKCHFNYDKQYLRLGL